METKYRISKTVLAFLLLNTLCIRMVFSQENNNLFWGQKPPADSAISFDIGVTFPDDRRASYLCFAPNDTDCYFTVWGEKFAWVKIFLVKYENGKYTPPVEVPFSMGYKTAGGFITKDGKKLFFNSKRDTIKTNAMDFYVVNNNGSTWSRPQILGSPFNTNYWDNSYSATNSGYIVFASNRPGGQKHDLYSAKILPDGSFAVENLTILNSPASEYGSFISPDGAYIIFTSERKGNIGRSDLYISFRDNNNEWTVPLNMEIQGEKYGINFKGKYQDSPYITRDGKYLFFNRNGIQWIRTSKLIGHLRKLAFQEH